MALGNVSAQGTYSRLLLQSRQKGHSKLLLLLCPTGNVLRKASMNACAHLWGGWHQMQGEEKKAGLAVSYITDLTAHCILGFRPKTRVSEVFGMAVLSSVPV